MNNIDFYDWVHNIKNSFNHKFNYNPKFPTFNNMSSEVQERMLRCGIETRIFQLGDNVDDLITLACCTMLQDSINSGRRRFTSFIGD